MSCLFICNFLIWYKDFLNIEIINSSQTNPLTVLYTYGEYIHI